MLACWNALISPAIFSGFIILFMSPIVFDVVAIASLNATFAPIVLFWKPTLEILLFAAYVRFFCFRKLTNCLASNVHASLFPSLAAFLISFSFHIKCHWILITTISLSESDSLHKLTSFFSSSSNFRRSRSMSRPAFLRARSFSRCCSTKGKNYFTNSTQ